mgnify:FL=1
MDGTEREMIIRMQQGEDEAFSWLFRKYQSRVLRMAYLISGNYADSEDIVQETFVKCYTYRRHLREPERFEPWLYQIMTRTAWRMVKKGRREQPAEEIREEEPLRTDAPLEAVIHSEERTALWEAVQSLELRQRTAVVLYYYNQISTREIAKAMGCLEGTVKSRLHTARKNLKQKLDAWEKEALYEKRTV